MWRLPTFLRIFIIVYLFQLLSACRFLKRTKSTDSTGIGICSAFNCESSKSAAGEKFNQCHYHTLCKNCLQELVSTTTTPLEMCEKIPIVDNRYRLLSGTLVVYDETIKNFIAAQQDMENNLVESEAETEDGEGYDRFEDEATSDESDLGSFKRRKHSETPLMRIIALQKSKSLQSKLKRLPKALIASAKKTWKKLRNKKQQLFIPYWFKVIPKSKTQDLNKCHFSQLNDIPIHVDIIVSPKPQKTAKQIPKSMTISASLSSNSNACTAPATINTKYLNPSQKIFLRLSSSLDIKYRTMTTTEFINHITRSLYFRIKCSNIELCTSNFFQVSVVVSCPKQPSWRKNQLDNLQSQQHRVSAAKEASEKIFNNIRDVESLSFKKLKEERNQEVKELEAKKEQRAKIIQNNQAVENKYYKILGEIQNEILEKESARKNQELKVQRSLPVDVLPPPSSKDETAMLQQKLLFSQQGASPYRRINSLTPSSSFTPRRYD